MSLPFGYCAVSDGSLVPDSWEQMIVERVAWLRRQGRTLREIAVILNGEGLSNRVNGPFLEGQIRRILKRHPPSGHSEMG